jgi:hypothetical protein
MISETIMITIFILALNHARVNALYEDTTERTREGTGLDLLLWEKGLRGDSCPAKSPLSTSEKCAIMILSPKQRRECVAV